MPASRKIIIVLFIHLAGLSLRAQQTASYQDISKEAVSRMDSISGLLNGVFYENIYYDAKGNPFLYGGVFTGGAIVFRSSFIEPVALRLDVYHQQVMVKPNPLDELIIVLPSELVDEFRLGGQHFIRMQDEDAPRVFMELVAKTGDLTFYKSWYKKRYKDYDGERLNYKFSDVYTRLYLHSSDGFTYVKKQKDLVNSFPGADKKSLRPILKLQELKPDKMNPQQLQELLDRCQEIHLKDKEE